MLASRIFGGWQDENPVESIKYIFIVHNSVFDNYTEPQTFNYTDFMKRKRGAQSAEARKAKINAEIEQYAFTVDLEEWVKSRKNRWRANSSLNKRKRDTLESDNEDGRSEQRCLKRPNKYGVNMYIKE
jgi:hypothetical protein